MTDCDILQFFKVFTMSIDNFFASIMNQNVLSFVSLQVILQFFANPRKKASLKTTLGSKLSLEKPHKG